MDISVEKFVDKQTKLLRIEEKAENDEYSQKLPQNIKEHTDIYIPYMKVKKSFNQVYHIHYVFERKSGKLLPHHRFSCGDRVNIGRMISRDVNDAISNGIIAGIDETTITVSMNIPLVEHEKQQDLFLLKILSNKFYEKMFNALDSLPKINSDLIDVAFGYKKPTSLKKLKFSEIKFCNKNLNGDQKKAVYHALIQKDISIIHGPPGTGKTTTLVEIILQMVAQNFKVLVCGPSNISVDNIVERLQKYEVKMARLGHPSRFLSCAVDYSLDKHTSKDDEINYLCNEIVNINNHLTNDISSSEKYIDFEDRKKLRKRLHDRTKFLEEALLNDVNVVLSTILTDSAINYYLPDNYFNVVIIDECSKALESACWVPMQRSKKCILAGDHFQLPPLIKAGDNAQELEVTIMDRLIDLHKDKITCMLTIQYRMNQTIMKWISKQLYDDRLTAYKSVANYLLKDLPYVQETEFTSVPLLMIDTAGCDYREIQEFYDDSRGNEDEADLLVYYLESLISSGLRTSDIGVITPYNFQVQLIKKRLKDTYPDIEVKSVDGFQGREKNAIVLSLVRSNRDGTVGFLADRRRANVAITRAKRHLAVICDSNTVSRNTFWKEFIDYINEVGEIRSAALYKNVIKQYVRKEIPKLRNQRKCQKENAKELCQKEKDTIRQMPNCLKSKSQNTYPENLSTTRDEDHGQFYAIVKEFVMSDDSVLILPVSYTTRERKIIHEIAENFGLSHDSFGEFPNRQLKLKKVLNENSKKKLCQEVPQLLVSSENRLKIETSRNNSSSACFSVHMTDSEVKAANTDSFMSESVLKGNKHIEKQDIRQINVTEKPDQLPNLENMKENLSCYSSVPTICSSEQSQYVENVKTGESLLEDFELDVATWNIQNEEFQQLTGAILKKSPKRRCKDKIVNKEKLSSGNNEDFETTINIFLKSEKICSHKDCKEEVISYMPKCEFCKKGFCSFHSQAEYHGCGDAAKVSVRNKFHKKLLNVENDKISEQKHHQNRQTLHKKLNELSAKRRSKNSKTQ